MGSGVAEAVGAGVGVAVGAGVAVAVGSGLGVAGGAGVAVAVGSGLGVAVAAGVAVAVGSGLGVAVGAGVAVGVGTTGAAVAVGSGPAVGVGWDSHPINTASISVMPITANADNPDFTFPLIYLVSHYSSQSPSKGYVDRGVGQPESATFSRVCFKGYSIYIP